MDNPIQLCQEEPYLSTDLKRQLYEHFEKDLHWTTQETRERLDEILKFLYLLSCYPHRFESSFFPLTNEADEVWHYLIIQTKAYVKLVMRNRIFYQLLNTPSGEIEFPSTLLSVSN